MITARVIVLYTMFCLLTSLVSCQQPQKTQYYIPGSLSEQCRNAINTTTDCPPLLMDLVFPHDLLQPAELELLCTSSCIESLRGARDNIEQQCDNATDVIVEKGIAYPATYFADLFIYAYEKSCVEDHDTGMFCDTLKNDWRHRDDWPSSRQCYNEVAAQDYEKKIADCGVAQDPIMVPPKYALNKTAHVNSKLLGTPRKECQRPYEIGSNDTCNSIAIAQNVSTLDLTYHNGLTPWCSNLPAAGQTLCLPEQCDTYVVQEKQNCWDIVDEIQAHGKQLTVWLLREWNPNLSNLCYDLSSISGTTICVSGREDPSSARSKKISAEAETVNPDRQVVCDHWQEKPLWDQNFNCKSLSILGVSAQDLLLLNPTLEESDCVDGQVLEDEKYCVQGDVDGNPINKANGPVRGRLVEVHEYPEDYHMPGDKADLAPIQSMLAKIREDLTIASSKQCNKPRASVAGTVPECSCYAKLRGSQRDSWNCERIAAAYSIGIDEFRELNPGMVGESCTKSLYAGIGENNERTVCVGKDT